MAINPQPQYPTAGSEFASSLSKGINDFVIKPEEERQQSKLQLAMLSKRLEMEANSKVNTAQRESELGIGKIPEEQAVNLAKSLGLDVKPLQGMGAINPAALDTYLKAGAMRGMMTSKVVDIDGEQHLITHDKAGNIVGNTAMGMDKTAQNAIRAAQAKFGGSENLINDIRSTVHGFINATQASMLPEQFANLTWQKLAQTNPKVKAYFDSLTDTAAVLNKQLTGTGRNAETLLSASRNALPQMTDLVGTSDAKLDRFHSFFKSVRDGEIEAYRKNPSLIAQEFDITHPNIDPGAGTPGPIHIPVPGHSPFDFAAEDARRAQMKAVGGQKKPSK